MENISFENFKYALIGFCANLATLGGLAYYIVRGMLSYLKVCSDVNEEQRGEVDAGTWAAKVAEIKARFPK